MKTKKIRENLFVSNVTLTEPADEMSDQEPIAEWARDKPFLFRRNMDFRLDNKLADQLEQVTRELQEMLPEHLRKEFNFSKLCEICFRELVDEYRRRRKKERSVLVQIVKVWSEQNEKTVGKNESKGGTAKV